MTRIVYAMQYDTLDRVVYRYYGDQSAQYLPAVLELNPNIQNVVLDTQQSIVLPDDIPATSTDTLKLWD